MRDELVQRLVVSSNPEELRAFGNNDADNGDGTILHGDRFQIPVYCETPSRGPAFRGIRLELNKDEIPRVGERIMCEHAPVGTRGRYKATAWTYLDWWDNACKIYGVFRLDGSNEQFFGQPYTGILQLSADWPTDTWDNGTIHYSTTDGAAFQLRELSNGLFVPCRRDPRIPDNMLPEGYDDREVLPE